MTTSDDDTGIMDTLVVFEFPIMHSLSEAQIRGAACVWCSSSLAPGEGVGFGGFTDWRPHTCAPCKLLRGAVLTTYEAWDAHQHGCVSCQFAACLGDPLCAQADGHRTALLEARTAAGKPLPTCAACKQEIRVIEEAFVPLAWFGESGPYRSFLHAGGCTFVGPITVHRGGADGGS
ncbi:hypothetical protein ACFVT5_42840 [Streptomyces sp. NPDC058001]|uniref:hypothetical protein n=1 Tax=Streptomyces sp. NPDC058001 TaxID=3346300 RepID=UPI0036ECBEF6